MLTNVLENTRDANLISLPPELSSGSLTHRPLRADFHDTGYFDLCPTDCGVDIRREIILALEAMGYVIKRPIMKFNSQHEIRSVAAPCYRPTDHDVQVCCPYGGDATRCWYRSSQSRKPFINGNAR